MFPGWMQIALVVLIIVLLFGRGKISELMGDVAKGITSFRKGLKEDASAADTPENGEDSQPAASLEAHKASTQNKDSVSTNTPLDDKLKK